MVDILFDLLEKIAKSEGGPTTLMVVVILAIVFAIIMGGAATHLWKKYREQKKINTDLSFTHVCREIEKLTKSVDKQTTALFDYHDDHNERLADIEGGLRENKVEINNIKNRCLENHAA